MKHRILTAVWFDDALDDDFKQHSKLAKKSADLIEQHMMDIRNPNVLKEDEITAIFESMDKAKMSESFTDFTGEDFVYLDGKIIRGEDYRKWWKEDEERKRVIRQERMDRFNEECLKRQKERKK